MPDHATWVQPLPSVAGPYGLTRMVQYVAHCRCGWQSVNATQALATQQGVTHSRASA
jgi:rhodanese-related sulfurtransferase